MKKYIYTDKTYVMLEQIRKYNPWFIFPDEMTERQLEEFGITVEEVPDSPEIIKLEQERKLRTIDRETEQAITAGFDYEINGESLHFSYDTNDQQNFADTANACLMARSGMGGLPDSVTWNAYRADGSLVRIELGADEFLALYAGGALAHKAACMEAGGAKKAELLAASG